MVCVSSFIVGIFSIGLLIYDLVEKEYDFLALHALGGAFFTLVFWFLCSFIGESLSLAVLVIPALFFLAFAFGIWMTRESLRKRGCCVKCVKNDTSASDDTSSSSEVKKEEECEFDGKLKAEQIV